MRIHTSALVPLLWSLLCPSLGARSVGTLMWGTYTFCSGSSLWTLDRESGAYLRQDRIPPPLDPGESCFWDGEDFLVAKFPPQAGVVVVKRGRDRTESPVITLRPGERLLGALPGALLTGVSTDGRSFLCLNRRPDGERQWIRERDPARRVAPGIAVTAITVDGDFLVFRNTGQVLKVSSKDGTVKTIQEDFWKAVGPGLHRPAPKRKEGPPSRPPGDLHADPIPGPDGRIHLLVTCGVKVHWTAGTAGRVFRAQSPAGQARTLAAEGLQRWGPGSLDWGGSTVFVISIDPASGTARLLDPGRYRALWRPHPHVALRVPRFERTGEFSFDKDGCLSSLKDILHERTRHSPPPE